jgi:hypothetical protein
MKDSRIKSPLHILPKYSQPDFFLFPKIKSTLKGRRYEDTEDIKKSVTKDCWRYIHMSSKSVSSNFMGITKVCDISRRILKDMFDFKCGFLKIYAVLELNCLIMYIKLLPEYSKKFFSHDQYWNVLIFYFNCVKSLIHINARSRSVFPKVGAAEHWCVAGRTEVCSTIYSPIVFILL